MDDSEADEFKLNTENFSQLIVKIEEVKDETLFRYSRIRRCFSNNHLTPIKFHILNINYVYVVRKAARRTLSSAKNKVESQYTATRGRLGFKESNFYEESTSPTRDYILYTVDMGVEENEYEKLLPGRICGAWTL
ncbi:hypothetical protein SDJN03_18074, partial [Cucurbita argyrosperma subsp. sororia]